MKKPETLQDYVELLLVEQQRTNLFLAAIAKTELEIGILIARDIADSVTTLEATNAVATLRLTQKEVERILRRG